MNKLGYYDAKWRDFEGETPLAKPFYNNDYSSFKFDSVHSIFYDKSIDGWLNFTPRAAVRLTYYDQTSDTKVDEFDLYRRSWANDPYSRRLYLGNDYDNDGGDTLRFVGELGYELSFKAYKTNLDAQSDLFGINGIRHVIEPYINHTYIPYVSEHREHLYYFDETDRIAEQHWMRYGVKNRIQTRRDGQVHNLVTINTWLDFHLPGGENDAHEGVGDFGTNIEFDPNDEFTFNNDVIVDVDSGDINIFSLTARIGDPDKLEYSLNYLYRNDYVSKNLYSNSSSYYNSVVTSPFSRVYERRSAFTAGVRCRLWYDNFLSLSASYDFEENEFIRYMIELQRRLHAWTGALRYEEYDDEYRIMVYMYLNAYPSANFGLKESE
jgi:hypothetical protein